MSRRTYYTRFGIYIDLDEENDYLRWKHLANLDKTSLNTWIKSMLKEATYVKYPKNNTKNKRVISYPVIGMPHKIIRKKVRMMTKTQLEDSEKEYSFIHNTILNEIRRRRDNEQY